MKLFIGVLLLSLSTSVAAFKCNSNGTQAEINRCAKDKFIAADKQLNKAWKALLRKSQNKSQIKKWRKAERMWIKFRDLELEAKFACNNKNKRVCWGSMYPSLYNNAITKLTLERTRQLKEHLKSPEEQMGGTGSIGQKDRDLLITTTSFFGLSRGDKIAAHSKILKKDVLKTGEGDFDVYKIMDGKTLLGYVYPHPKNKKLIGDIEITSSLASTKNGIRISSTLADLEKIYPNIKIHGSEIEGRTYAVLGKMSFKLDVYLSTYKVDRSKIKKSTKITQIRI